MISTVTDVTHAMQTAIGPVFLIMGAGTLLASMSMRFGRIIDRARALMDQGNLDWSELRVLHRRARLLRLTIILDSACIFFVALTIFVIFGSLLFNLDARLIVPFLFSASVASLIVALALFIKDFAISLRVFESQLTAAKALKADQAPPSDLMGS